MCDSRVTPYFSPSSRMGEKAISSGADHSLIRKTKDSPDPVRAVAARGGLAGYLTVLENAFAYIPNEDVILGVLKAGDVADIAAALSPRPLVMEGLVNGRNIQVEEHMLLRTLDPARTAYRDAGAAKALTAQILPLDVSAWLAVQLK